MAYNEDLADRVRAVLPCCTLMMRWPGKMDALFNRWAPRDFLDVDAILASGHYTQQQLMAVAADGPCCVPDRR